MGSDEPVAALLALSVRLPRPVVNGGVDWYNIRMSKSHLRKGGGVMKAHDRVRSRRPGAGRIRSGLIILLAAAALGVFSGCDGEQAAPGAPAETAAPTPTATPAPTPSPTPAPTPEPERTLSAYGVEFSSYARELDLSGVPVEDGGAALEALLPSMMYLETVDMSDCGVNDEEMDALNRRYEDIRFLWTVYFGRAYYLRTDETSFIASLFHGNQSAYSNLSDEEVMKLRYCTDMVALDLGHMTFTTCEFARYMPHLRYLIISDTHVEDISPLAGLEELWYLEMFLTRVTDLSPLLECPNLRHLNISYCDIHDSEDILKMTYLERLWYMSPYLTWDVYHAIEDTLTETEVQMGMTGSSMGGTWRAHPAYYEMRDALGAFYIPPP